MRCSSIFPVAFQKHIFCNAFISAAIKLIITGTAQPTGPLSCTHRHWSVRPDCQQCHIGSYRTTRRNTMSLPDGFETLLWPNTRTRHVVIDVCFAARGSRIRADCLPMRTSLSHVSQRMLNEAFAAVVNTLCVDNVATAEPQSQTCHLPVPSRFQNIP